MELTKRKQNILASIVDGYIRTGEPVGSKSIAEKAGVSSATVRNEMAELTELGLLEQPHTSAGRVPSQEGYREFVDALMQPETLTEAEKLTIDAMLAKSAFDPERLLRGAAKTLAASTRYLALSTTPSGADAKIKAVQFVQTSRRTAMLIMMSSAGTMKNKVFHCDFDLSNEIMRIFFRVLNERVTGRDVAEINRVTGYIRGGCTAIGMKKQYVTRIDESAKTQEQIYVSGGRIGSQIQLKPDDLAKAAKAEFADIIRHEN